MIISINPDVDFETPEQVLKLVIQHLLFESDWTQLPNCPLSPTKVNEWATWRQMLRDFPATWKPGPTVTFPDTP